MSLAASDALFTLIGLLLLVSRYKSLKLFESLKDLPIPVNDVNAEVISDNNDGTPNGVKINLEQNTNSV